MNKCGYGYGGRCSGVHGLVAEWFVAAWFVCRRGKARGDEGSVGCCVGVCGGLAAEGG